MKQLSLVVFFVIFNGLVCFSQRTRVENVRLSLDSTTQELVVTYNLVSFRPGDSLAVRFLGDGKPLKAKSVSGIGYHVEAGNDRKIRWNFIQDSIRGRANLEAEVFGYRPGIFAGKTGAIRVAGLVGAVGLGVYSAILGSKITSDVNSYNNAPDPTSFQDDQSLNVLKDNVSRNKTIFVSAVSLSAVLLLADVFLLSRSRKPSNYKLRTTAPMGTPSLTLTRFIR